MAITKQINTTQPVKPGTQVPQVGLATPNTTTGNNWISNIGTSTPPASGGMFDAQPATPGMNAPASPRPSGDSPLASALNPYQPGGEQSMYSAENRSATGGVSAVNPQAGMADYNSLKRFEDAAYNQAMQRLDPQLQQQSSKFDQDMINRGIGVGSEAYNEAKQALDFNQNDARSSAAFNAMGFGQGVQNQMFGQDATRSGLANSLLQAQMGNQLGYANLNQRGEQFGQGLSEQGRQFDNMFNQRNDQFYAGLGENQRQFDDRSNMAWDAQGYGQMMGLDSVNFRNNAYNDSRSDYGNQLLMSLLGYGGGQNPQWNADPNSVYNAQLGYEAGNYGNRIGAMSGIASAAAGAY